MKKFPVTAWILLFWLLLNLVGAFIASVLFLNGVLLLFFLGVLVYDCCCGRLSKLFLILPVAFLTWYYSLWSTDMFELWSLKKEIAKNTSLPMIKYKPEKHSLVVPDFGRSLTIDYDVLYTPAVITDDLVKGENLNLILEKPTLTLTEDSGYLLRMKEQLLDQLETVEQVIKRDSEAFKGTLYLKEKNEVREKYKNEIQVLVEKMKPKNEEEEYKKSLLVSKEYFELRVEALKIEIEQNNPPENSNEDYMKIRKKWLASFLQKISVIEIKLQNLNKAIPNFYAQRFLPKEICSSFDILKGESALGSPKAINTVYYKGNSDKKRYCLLQFAENPKLEKLEVKLEYSTEETTRHGEFLQPKVEKIEIYLEDKKIGQYVFENNRSVKLIPFPYIGFGCSMGVVDDIGCHFETFTKKYSLGTKDVFVLSEFIENKQLEIQMPHLLNNDFLEDYAYLFVKKQLSGGRNSLEESAILDEAYEAQIRKTGEGWSVCFHSEENCKTEIYTVSAASDPPAPVFSKNKTSKSRLCNPDPSYICYSPFTKQDIYQKKIDLKLEPVNDPDFEEWGICTRYIDMFEPGCARYENKCNYCQLTFRSWKGSPLTSFWDWAGRFPAPECTKEVLKNRLEDRMSCVAKIAEPAVRLDSFNEDAENKFRYFEIR